MSMPLPTRFLEIHFFYVSVEKYHFLVFGVWKLFFLFALWYLIVFEKCSVQGVCNKSQVNSMKSGWIPWTDWRGQPTGLLIGIWARICCPFDPSLHAAECDHLPPPIARETYKAFVLIRVQLITLVDFRDVFVCSCRLRTSRLQDLPYIKLVWLRLN